jgi:hypothetical protein
MKIEVKSFNSFNESSSLDHFGTPVNEGLFDKLKTFFSKVTGMFTDKEKLSKSVESTVTQAGDKAKIFTPKSIKDGDTTMVVLGDGKTSATDFTVAFTKLSDLPDGSSLFQISGTTSEEMLKALTGTNKNEDLALNSVMAILTAGSFTKGKPATMKLLKNMIPGGKDYLTKAVFIGAVPNVEVEKTMAKVK